VNRTLYPLPVIFLAIAACGFLSLSNVPGIWAAQAAGDQSVQGQQQKSQSASSTPSQNTSADSQEPFVIERFLTRAAFEQDGSSRIDREATVHVLNESGVEQFGQLVFGYNSTNQKIEIVSVEVRKAGSSTFASASAVRDVSPIAAGGAHLYSDYREKRVTVAGLHAGDTLAYHIASITTIPSAPGQFWFEHSFLKEPAALDEELEIRVPLKRAITLKTLPGADPLLSEEGEYRIYRWKSSPASREAGDSKPSASGPNVPAVQITTFRDWAEVGRWYSPLQAGPATPDDAVRAKARELTQGRNTQLEKIEALYDFVATKIRTANLPFGEYSIQPHPASEILASEYGEVQDKHTLLAALLQAEGIYAYPVLIPSARAVDPELPSPGQFNYLVTVIPRGADSKDWLWLDTAAEVAPFQMLAAALRAKQGLMIPIDSPDAALLRQPALLIETPSDPPSIQVQKIEVSGKVSTAGKLTAHIHYSMAGDNELALRIAFRNTPQENWTQIGQLLAAGDGFRGQVTGVKSSDPLDTHTPLEVDYQISQSNFLDVSRKKLQLRMPLPALGIPESAETAGHDIQPLKLGSPLEVHIRATVEIPAKYSPRAPVPTSVSRDYAAYHSNYSVKSHEVTATRDIEFRQRQIPAALLADYNAFAHAVRADESQSISLETVTTPAPSVPEKTKSR
jgi:hypothetical protein